MRQVEVDGFFRSERPEYVFLAAAKVGGILANNTYPAEFIYSNLMIQAHVIHAAYVSSVQKLLFLGSSCIYPRNCPQPMKEDYLLSGKLEPTNEPYAIAKIAGITMCQSYNRQYGTRFISVMPTNLYGPNDNFDLETSHALPALIRKFHLAKLATQEDWEGIKRDESFYGPIPDDIKLSSGLSNPSNPPIRSSVTIWGSGNAFREFLHVDDMADASLFLMNHYDDDRIINIGTGKEISIKELAEMIKEVVGFQGDVRYDSSKPDGTPRKLLDVSRLESLGWRSKIALREGIRRTYQWYLENQIPEKT
jgi:GDP-L-fucose synthase